ncbi:hypothetical protein [Alkalibaculum bacchi]|uniref:hypothetical protein n=1 Tax=Alkalibaculum bacchi TaxID=645887 RepID=UPI0026EDE3C1|nr:hypothetical protein [Alkalibaculum bacchi]
MKFKIVSTEVNKTQSNQIKAKNATVAPKETFANVLDTYLLEASTDDSLNSISIDMPIKNERILRTILGSVDMVTPTKMPNSNHAAAAYGHSIPLVTSDGVQQIARNITALYEGGGVAGNFDGQGLSLGYLQWNIGSNTLQPLLREMSNNTNTKKDFEAIFSGLVQVTNNNGSTATRSMSDEIRRMLDMTSSQQLAWAKSLNTRQNKIKEPWKSAIGNLIQNNSFKLIQDQYARPYFDKANKIVNDSTIGVKTIRGYSLAFDIAVQNGSIKSSAYDLIVGALSGENNKLTNPNNSSLSRNQRAVVLDLQSRLKNVSDSDTRKLYYTAAAVAICAKDQYAKDVWSRKSTIIAGTGTVHGKNLALNKAGLSDDKLV